MYQKIRFKNGLQREPKWSRLAILLVGIERDAKGGMAGFTGRECTNPILFANIKSHWTGSQNFVHNKIRSMFIMQTIAEPVISAFVLYVERHT
jgi:hypothetical protein